jgi:hypothetical protein
MKRSKLLIGVGFYMALGGVAYFISPSPNSYDGRGMTPFTALVCAWFVACGLGLALHKKWSAWLYIAGTGILTLHAAATVFQSGETFSAAIGKGLFTLMLLGLPLIPIWFRRRHLGFGAPSSTPA